MAHQRTIMAALRAALRPALALIERSADQGTLLALPWYRQGKQALNARLDDAADDYPPCKHCGLVGGH